MHRHLSRATLLAAALLAAAPAAGLGRAAAQTHVTDAEHFVDWIDPANNSYGTPAALTEIGHDTGLHEVHNVSKCGSFLAELFKGSYPALTANGDAIAGLTGSSSPTAAKWLTAIQDEKSWSGFALQDIASIDDWAVGDLLVSTYSGGDGSGHAMLIVGFHVSTAADDGGQLYAPPAPPDTTRYTVTVIDSSKNDHTRSGQPDDTRTGANLDGSDDQGMGRGILRVYVDDGTGAVVGWMWSLYNGGDYYSQSALSSCPVTNPSKSCSVRPLVVGRLTGI